MTDTSPMTMIAYFFLSPSEKGQEPFIMLGLELIESLNPLPILILLNGTNISFPLETSKERISI